jgi:hypothetical protein
LSCALAFIRRERADEYQGLDPVVACGRVGGEEASVGVPYADDVAIGRGEDSAQILCVVLDSAKGVRGSQYRKALLDQGRDDPVPAR